jgi:hypothetical protein
LTGSGRVPGCAAFEVTARSHSVPPAPRRFSRCWQFPTRGNRERRRHCPVRRCRGSRGGDLSVKPRRPTDEMPTLQPQRPADSERPLPPAYRSAPTPLSGCAPMTPAEPSSLSPLNALTTPWRTRRKHRSPGSHRRWTATYTRAVDDDLRFADRQRLAEQGSLGPVLTNEAPSVPHGGGGGDYLMDRLGNLPARSA